MSNTDAEIHDLFEAAIARGFDSHTLTEAYHAAQPAGTKATISVQDFLKDVSAGIWDEFIDDEESTLNSKENQP
jgi:hypothetical protein